MLPSNLSKSLTVSLLTLALAACGSSSDEETVVPVPEITQPEPTPDTSGGDTSTGGDSTDTSTGGDTTTSSNVSINLVSSLAVSERATTGIEGDVSLPADFNLSWNSSSAVITNAVLSNDRKRVLIDTGNIASGTNKVANLSLEFSNGTESHSAQVQVDVRDTMPDTEQTFKVESEVGQKLLNIANRQIDNITNYEFYLNGLLVSDKEHDAHRTEVQFIDLADSSTSIAELPSGTWKIGTNKVYDYHVLKNQEDRVWLVEDTKFDANLEFKVKQQSDILPSVVLWNVGETTVFRFAYLHDNAYFINSLLRAYQSTSDPKYLAMAKPTVDTMINLLWDNLYQRRFMIEKKFYYTGMDQGIILESVYNYSKFAQSPEYYQKAKDIAGVFKHTTEGTWNHYTNSLIGGLIVEDMNIPNALNFQNLVDSQSSLLVNEIRRLNGRIPYIMKTDDPRYLTFDYATYHTYDMMLIAKQAMFIDGRLGSSDVMDAMINRITANYASYYANNVDALMYSYLASGYTNIEFAQKQAGKIDVVTSTIQNHVSNLRAATSFLYMNEHTDHPKLTYKFKN